MRVFGSVACGTARRNRDFDFLVDMEEGRSLPADAALILDVERLLKRPMDVASQRGRRRLVRRKVMTDTVSFGMGSSGVRRVA